MQILVESLPELLGALGSTGLISAATWYISRRRHRTARSAEQRPTPSQGMGHRRIRTYTLLGTGGREGAPIRVMSTRTAGAVLLWPTGGRQERFELTDCLLSDGTYAAEPVDGFEKVS
ncbi:hypothetical protein [Streptomyces sp. enrichment culture]|uniref:hypothetical protein n=1 Tax=Streptomyces sp. enrichment culture TaxID=1795815 RepID=UPI003F57AB75